MRGDEAMTRPKPEEVAREIAAKIADWATCEVGSELATAEISPGWLESAIARHGQYLIAAALRAERAAALKDAECIAMAWTDVSPDEDARGVAMRIAREIRAAEEGEVGT